MQTNTLKIEKPYDERLRQFWKHRLCPITGQEFSKYDLLRKNWSKTFGPKVYSTHHIKQLKNITS